jgi:hypothetical protein
MNLKEFSVATFNLFNLQDPGKPMNRGQTPWTETEFKLKVQWTVWQLTTIKPDVVGLQELWSKKALDAVLDYNYGTAAEPKRLKDTYEALAPPQPARKSSAVRSSARDFVAENRSGKTSFPTR